MDKLAAKAKDPAKIATAFMGLFQNPVRRRGSAYRTERSRADRGVEGGDTPFFFGVTIVAAAVVVAVVASFVTTRSPVRGGEGATTLAAEHTVCRR